MRCRTFGSAAPNAGNWQSSSVDGAECLLAPERNSEPAQSAMTLGRPGQGVAAASSPRRVTLEWCVSARCGSMASKTRSRLFGTEHKMLNMQPASCRVLASGLPPADLSALPGFSVESRAFRRNAQRDPSPDVPGAL